MKLRRSTALAAGALLLSAPALTACGFEQSTFDIYTPAMGANDREGTVDVLGGVIVASEDGSGTFVATLSNNDQEEAVTFEGVSGDEEDAALEVGEVTPVEIPRGGLLNLSDAEQIEPISVDGEFRQGDFVTVTLTFGNGQSTTVDVPVVRNEDYFGGLDGPAVPAPETPKPEVH